MILRLPLLLLCFMGFHSVQAQFREVMRPDVDARITIHYFYELTSPGLNEELRFKVTNRTPQELRVTIKATARYQCMVTKSFDVGINGSVHLPPYGVWDGKSDLVHSVLQKSKDCYTEVEKGKFSSLIQCDFWVKVEDLSAQKAAQAAQAAKAAAAASQPASAGSSSAAKSQPGAARPSSAATASSSVARSGAASKDDDFWETGAKPAAPAGGSKAPAGGIDGTGMPEFVKTTDGKYYQKDAHNKMQEISYDRYMQIRHERSQAGKQPPAARTMTKEETDAALKKYNEQVSTELNKSFETQKAIDQKFDQYAQTAAANRAVADSREALEEASSLSGNYQSIEQLKAEFDQKMRQVNSAVENLRVNKNAAWNSAVSSSFGGGNSTDAAIGETLKAVGGIVNAARAEKERKEALEQLRLEKKAAEYALIAEEKRLLGGIRSDLFARLPEGSIPLSSSKISANTLYYFVYSYDKAQIGEKQPLLYLSNVFAVSRYSDGTWPFKTSFASEIQKLTPYAEVMHGYYTSAGEAESMRQGLQDLFQQSGGLVKPVVYRNKKPAAATPGAANGDFWETGTKKEAEEKKSAKKDDSWNN